MQRHTSDASFGSSFIFGNCHCTISSSSSYSSYAISVSKMERDKCFFPKSDVVLPCSVPFFASTVTSFGILISLRMESLQITKS